MCAASKTKLTIELIPKTCHFSNVRTMVSPKDWDKLRFASYEAANNKCEICGDNGLNQGYKHKVECHEVWEYNDQTHTQKLIKLVALCVKCHQVKHIGRAIAIGKQMECFIHLAKVNKWTQKQIDDHVIASFELHKERSKHQWKLDISLIEKEPYNIKMKPIKERIFKVVKYKKKPKKKTPITQIKKKTIHPKAKIAGVLKSKTTNTKKRPPKK